MCGGSILAELIPPPRRAAPPPVTAGNLWPGSSKKGGSGRNKKHGRLDEAEIDDFEAAFEEFHDDFDAAEEEDEDDYGYDFVFGSKTAFSPAGKSISFSSNQAYVVAICTDSLFARVLDRDVHMDW
jgi:EREBP-like factor